MTTQREAFEKWAMKYYGETVMTLHPPEHYLRPNEYRLDTYRNAWEGYKAALSQPNEPVARVIHQFETPEGTREILCVRLVDRLDVHTKLYTSPPNTSELEQENKLLEARCKYLIEKLHESASNFVEFVQIDHPKALGERDAQIAELEVILRDRDSELEIEYANVAELTAKLEKMREALANSRKTLNDVIGNGLTCDKIRMIIDEALEECK